MEAEQSRFEAERAELQALLDSGVFGRSPNLYKFLSFICEKYFSGQTEDIKEYAVAVEALGRSLDFDQKRDSIVRVEAYRLRKRLDEYYRTEGASHPIRIQLPPGSYVPRFIPNPRAESESAPVTPPIPLSEEIHVVEPPLTESSEEAESPPTVRPRKRLLVAVFAVVAVLVLLGMLAAYRVPKNEAVTEVASSVADVTASVPTPKATTLSFVGQHIEPIRILAGSHLPSYVDKLGNTWTGDAYFEGGNAMATKLSLLNYTSTPEIYAHHREGEFRYAIPVRPGYYELRLHFAEPVLGGQNPGVGGETSRLFDVSLNGKKLLTYFDITTDAFGSTNANVKVFKDVQPAADGKLHLSFEASHRESAVLSAIEVIPAKKGVIQPIRIVANERGFVDANGNYWRPDDYVHGGRYARRAPVKHPDYDPTFFTGERYGNFTYMLPVAQDGRYRLRLYFCERWWGPDTQGGGGAGSRRFDVFVNGQALLSDFDVYSAAGGNGIPIMREFPNLKPNAQGKLIVQFVPRQNYAMVNAIEVLDESR